VECYARENLLLLLGCQSLLLDLLVTPLGDEVLAFLLVRGTRLHEAYLNIGDSACYYTDASAHLTCADNTDLLDWKRRLHRMNLDIHLLL
jgi:hypothetical protein